MIGYKTKKDHFHSGTLFWTVYFEWNLYL